MRASARTLAFLLHFQGIVGLANVTPHFANIRVTCFAVASYRVIASKQAVDWDFEVLRTPRQRMAKRSAREDRDDRCGTAQSGLRERQILPLRVTPHD